jgi:hypothetical protein
MTAFDVTVRHGMADKAARGESMDCKLLSRVPGEEHLSALRASGQHLFYSHRFPRACHNQALPRTTHRADKRPGCASWSRGLAAALAVLRPSTRRKTPTVPPPNGGGSSLPQSWWLYSVASRSPFTVPVNVSPLRSRMREYKLCANWGCQAFLNTYGWPSISVPLLHKPPL